MIAFWISTFKYVYITLKKAKVTFCKHVTVTETNKKFKHVTVTETKHVTVTETQCCSWRHGPFPANWSMEYLIPDVYLTFEICLCNITTQVAMTFLFLITLTYLNGPVIFGMLTFIPNGNTTLRLESHMSL